jgi:hypothetical protein
LQQMIDDSVLSLLVAPMNLVLNKKAR